MDTNMHYLRHIGNEQFCTFIIILHRWPFVFFTSWKIPSDLRLLGDLGAGYMVIPLKTTPAAGLRRPALSRTRTMLFQLPCRKERYRDSIQPRLPSACRPYRYVLWSDHSFAIRAPPYRRPHRLHHRTSLA